MLLGYKTRNLTSIIYGIKDNQKYTSFQINKKNGGKREINAPVPKLKLLQRRLADLLQDCIDEINKEKKQKKVLSHGFRRNFWIFTNAEVHTKRRFVLNVDLTDFFSAINFGRVQGFFIKNHNFELNSKIATTIAQIACHEGKLPQGSPCSPVLSNLIGHQLDIRLAQLARKYKVTYSRYADDLTFSTNQKDFPIAIGKKASIPHSWEVGEELNRLINRAGFAVNPRKVRLQYRNSRQEVTGLVVNKKTGIPFKYWRNARAMTHSLLNTGKFYISKKVVNPNGEVTYEQTEGSLNQLNGILSYIDSIDVAQKKKDKHLKYRCCNSRESNYSKYLFYKNFLALEKPTIICEGKTDNIYLRCAIKSLWSTYPKLVNKDKNNKKLQIRLFHYTDLTNRLLHLAGGAGDLNNFITEYQKHTKKIKYKPMKFPVVILLDDDSGVKGILNKLKNILHVKEIDRGNQFHFLGDNLYVVLIPRIGGKPTVIEQYFTRPTLNTKINGKKFDLHKSYGSDTSLSKFKFAKVIVEKQQDKINFDNFKKIIDRIESAINNYRC